MSLSLALPVLRLYCRRRLRSCAGTLKGAARPRLFAASSRCQNLELQSEGIEPFRKQWKTEKKQKRLEKLETKPKDAKPADDAWELTVGIEIHAQLNSQSKLFSDASTLPTNEPNSQVAEFDFALPGAQPIFQRQTLLPAIRAALALNCDVQYESRFDRKHYFYQDQPAGYQITQYYKPFAQDGHVTLYKHDGIAAEDGGETTVGIKQVQMEQDTAKTILDPPNTHLIDFNRVSHPLIEIITLPVIHHSSTAAAFVRKVQALLFSTNACTTGMEAGGLRADVNVSVRRKQSHDLAQVDDGDTQSLGQRTEIKNLSSFAAIQDAIEAEKRRQIGVLEAGGQVVGETRGWVLGSTETRRLRAKEGEVDYRYMPDPDVPPLFLTEGLVSGIRNDLPLLPDQWLSHLTNKSNFCLRMDDAKALVSLDEGKRLAYYLDVVDALGETHQDSKSRITAANWVLHELGGLLSSSGQLWEDQRVGADQLAELLRYLFAKKVTGQTAKYVLGRLFSDEAGTASDLIDEENLWLVPIGEEEYKSIAQSIVDNNSNAVKAIRQGQTGKIKFLLGQVLRECEDGRGEALKAEAALREVLGVP